MSERLTRVCAALVCVVAQAIKEARADGETEVLVYEGTPLLGLLIDAAELLRREQLDYDAAAAILGVREYLRDITNDDERNGRWERFQAALTALKHVVKETEEAVHAYAKESEG